jgi:hypothetical protein
VEQLQGWYQDEQYPRGERYDCRATSDLGFSRIRDESDVLVCPSHGLLSAPYEYEQVGGCNRNWDQRHCKSQCPVRVCPRGSSICVRRNGMLLAQRFKSLADVEVVADQILLVQQ